MTDNPLYGKQICFIGAGSMAEAIMRGLVETDAASAESIHVVNRSDQARLTALKERYKITPAFTDDERKAAVHSADIIMLAMKPKDAQTALTAFRDDVPDDALIVSVIAGMPIRAIQSILQTTCSIVRSMPNTSSTIGLGATGICFSEGTDEYHRKQAEALFNAVGDTVIVDEHQIDTVTGISGSGPAYFYYMMEAMIAAGVENGLDEDTAKRLTVQTVLGAANMVYQTGEAPAELRQKVTSPGGTTQAALESMEQNNFAGTIREAVRKAADRAHEIEQELFGNR